MEMVLPTTGQKRKANTPLAVAVEDHGEGAAGFQLLSAYIIWDATSLVQNDWEW